MRIAYNLFTQRPKHEIEDFESWTSAAPHSTKETRPCVLMAPAKCLSSRQQILRTSLSLDPIWMGHWKGSLRQSSDISRQQRWPFRLHATYNESIERFLNVFENVNRDIPFNGLHWFFDHAETVSDRILSASSRLVAGLLFNIGWLSKANTLWTAMAQPPRKDPANSADAGARCACRSRH